MKAVVCDCCGASFEYDELTAKTDGEYATVKVGILNVRVCISVKAHNGIDYADICPSCRVKAMEEHLGESLSRHPQCGFNIN